MPKIRVKSKLSGNNETHRIESSGILRDNKIIYYENNLKVTIILEENVVTLLRESNEYRLTLAFEENKMTTGEYRMKSLPAQIEAIVKTYSMKKQENRVQIDYHLLLGTEDLGNFTFLLEYEVDV